MTFFSPTPFAKGRGDFITSRSPRDTRSPNRTRAKDVSCCRDTQINPCTSGAISGARDRGEKKLEDQVAERFAERGSSEVEPEGLLSRRLGNCRRICI